MCRGVGVHQIAGEAASEGFHGHNRSAPLFCDEVSYVLCYFSVEGGHALGDLLLKEDTVEVSQWQHKDGIWKACHLSACCKRQLANPFKSRLNISNLHCLVLGRSFSHFWIQTLVSDSTGMKLEKEEKRREAVSPSGPESNTSDSLFDSVEKLRL